MNDEIIRESIAQYYTHKVSTYGATPQGVDWNSEQSQRLRFVQLMKLVEGRQRFRINDYGCGYGALVDYLSEKKYSFQYSGYDVSAEMIARARDIHSDMNQTAFVMKESSLATADYTVASGVFNVKLDVSADEWSGYVLRTLGRINEISSKGFAFNVLTNYADPPRMRPDLYYADPLRLFDYCKKKFSRFVSLIHDYPLYECTILIRKDATQEVSNPEPTLWQP